jgi:hypothetical protein
VPLSESGVQLILLCFYTLQLFLSLNIILLPVMSAPTDKCHCGIHCKECFSSRGRLEIAMERFPLKHAAQTQHKRDTFAFYGLERTSATRSAQGALIALQQKETQVFEQILDKAVAQNITSIDHVFASHFKLLLDAHERHVLWMIEEATKLRGCTARLVSLRKYISRLRSVLEPGLTLHYVQASIHVRQPQALSRALVLKRSRL